ncbi:MAG: tripartite tricarboxylate transporter substrate binding protein [Comamonadaceae bacterium]|nr:MAG: tripartite tricarboxylate transporter substrate binding protein [Comamonadaceae bacterium]
MAAVQGRVAGAGDKKMNVALRRPLAVLGLLAASLLAFDAVAQGWPTKPVRFVVAYTPGGVVDNTARVVGERMSRDLGQAVVIENRAGANGQIGAELVVRSPADGNTVLLTSVGIAYRQHLVKVPYDPIKDFAPISLLAINPLMLVINPKLPVRTLAELIAYAKTRPGGLRYGTSGTGGPSHLAGELFKSNAGIEMIHVPYKGDSAAVLDLLGGNVDLTVSSISATVSQIKAGKLVAVALMTAKRSPLLPDVPTTDEAGFPGLHADSWVGMMAPARTPPAVVQRLQAAAMTALADPAVRENLVAGGNAIVGNTPEQFAQFLAAESDKWGQVIRRARIQVDE